MGNEEIVEIIEEREYIISPHPESLIAEDEITEEPEAPIFAEGSLPDLIERAVEGLRSELLAELESQARNIQAGLQKELKGVELNAKN